MKIKPNKVFLYKCARPPKLISITAAGYTKKSIAYGNFLNTVNLNSTSKNKKASAAITKGKYFSLNLAIVDISTFDFPTGEDMQST